MDQRRKRYQDRGGLSLKKILTRQAQIVIQAIHDIARDLWYWQDSTSLEATKRTKVGTDRRACIIVSKNWRWNLEQERPRLINHAKYREKSKQSYNCNQGAIVVANARLARKAWIYATCGDGLNEDKTIAYKTARHREIAERLWNGPEQTQGCAQQSTVERPRPRLF